MERGYVHVIPSVKINGHGQMQGTPVKPTGSDGIRAGMAIYNQLDSK